MLRIVVCVSGGGTNLQAIIDGIENRTITNTQIVRVISNNKNAYALERAKQAGIEAVCVSPREYSDREQFNEALLQKTEQAAPDLIVLAGFLVVIPPELIRRYENRGLRLRGLLCISWMRERIRDRF